MPEADVGDRAGQPNSSNSLRLAEMARALRQAGVPDRRRRRDRAELVRDAETVLVTAGASAPEEVVQECVAYLQGITAPRSRRARIREEDVSFQLPKELRALTVVN